MSARTPDRSLGEAGRLRSQRSNERVLLVTGAVLLANLALLLGSLELFLVAGFYVGGPAGCLFLIAGWQWLQQGRQLPFERSVAPRADRLREVAAGLDGGRLERSRFQATALGRRGGVEVEVGCWISGEELPDEDSIGLRLRTQRPPPWRGTYRGLKTHPPGQTIVLFGGPAPTVPDVHVYGGKEKPPLGRAHRERLVPLLNVVTRAELEVDGQGLLLRLGAERDAFVAGRLEWCLDELIAVARTLGLPLSDTPALDVVVRRPTRRETAPDAADCPYCRMPVVDDEWRCEGCRTAHHQACKAEHGGCTVLGCSGGPSRARARG